MIDAGPHRPHLVVALRDCGARAIGGNALRRASALTTAFRVSIVSDRFPDSLPEGVAGVRIASRDWRALHRFAHVPAEWSFARAARRAIHRLHREDPVSFLLCHGYAVARFAGLPLRGALGVPFGMFMHGHIFERPAGTYDRRLTAFYRAIAPSCYREADLLFALSPSQAALAIAAGGAPERTVVAPNGIDPDDVGLGAPASIPDDAEPRFASEALRLLYVGRFSPEKGVPVLLAACARLAADGRPFRLTLVGTGPDEARARALVHELGIGARCDFAGAVPRLELGRFYRYADVLCVPSISEPQGNVVLEGMCAGCLVVASDTGGIPSMVGHEISGDLVPPGDAAALATRLARVAADLPRATRVAKAGQRVATEQFGWPAIGARIATAILGALPGESPDVPPAAAPDAARPRVSVAIPTFGRREVLLETVGHLLRQVPPPAEILVVDQNPELDAETRSALGRWHDEGAIRWFRRPRPSIPEAMNFALREARGEVVLFVDDDVRPEPGLIGAHAATYRAGDVAAVTGQVLQPGETPSVSTAYVPGDGLRRDLGFRFSGTRRALVANCMAGNLSVRRDVALRIGGFDENFVRVAHRFETEFARRLTASGGKIVFEPRASLHHLRAPRGGTRGYGNHLRAAGPDHSVGDYYYALRCGRGVDRVGYMAGRFFRAVRTRYHLTHPWWIPVKLLGELRGLAWAFRLHRRGPQLLTLPAREV